MNRVKFSCSVSVQSNASIDFEVSGMFMELISSTNCIGTTGDPTISSCTRTLNDMNVKIMCNYSINYQIHCTFSWNLTDSIINQGRVYPVACHVNDGVNNASTRTELTVRGKI